MGMLHEAIFPATRNATKIALREHVTREKFAATRNATKIALRVARKIASCNMAFNSEPFVAFSLI